MNLPVKKLMHIKNILSYTLITSLVLTFFCPVDVHASGCSSYDSCIVKQEFYQEQKGGGEDPSFTAIKDQLPPGTPYRNKNNLPFNYKLWHDKGIVVYGNYSSVPNNDFVPATQYYESGVRKVVQNSGYYKDSIGRKGEYRFHGYDVNGNKYTNVNFVDDLNSGESLANKYWLYQPWDNPLTPEKTRPKEIGEYNWAAIENKDIDTQKWINATLAGWDIRNNRGPDGKINTAPSNQAYHYVYVMSTPTSTLPGEGRMWHRWSNDSTTYYQTFSIPAVKKNKNNVEVTIELLTPELELKFPENAPDDMNNTKKKLNFKVTATLKDESFHDNNVKRVTNYTRFDVDHWVINLKGVNNEQIKMIGQISWKDNKAWAEFEKELTIAKIKDLNKKYTVTADAYAVYVDGEESFPGSNIRAVDFEGRLFVPPKKEEPHSEPPPVIVDPKPNIPHPWFDIVKYPASDNTDMSTVATREVYINGQKVDDDLFFSGNYVFGDGNHGLKRIDIYYTSLDGYPAEVTRWVYIYPTKPRAQFSFSGTYKQNRKMTLTETSNSANDEFVISHYPINKYEWTFKTIEGDESSLKMRDISQVYKELMYKEPGTYQVELVVTNTLGRRSDPYILTFQILEDTPPAVICNLNYNVVSRGETISAYAYEAVSTDVDTIASNRVEIYYDSDNDDECEELIATFDSITEFPAFTPTELGNYKIVNTVKEEFGEDTLEEFIT
ncbi:MAG TPA: hypothetical protein GXX14_09015, partial [Clostridiaceae bacterium]|nr:hypothetical protein [Clostridiaceae bacterium]